MKLSKCPPSIRGNCSSRGAIFSGSMGNVSFLIITALWTKSFDLMDGIWYIWSLLNRENFLKIMLFSISRSMHVSWSYELKRNRTATSVFFILFFPLFFSFINEMLDIMYFELILSVFVQEKWGWMRSGASVRAAGCSAVREKKQLISTHVIMFFYMYCVRCWNVWFIKL